MASKLRFLLSIVILTTGLFLSACSAYADKAEVNQFIDKMVKKYHFNRAQLVHLFNTVTPNRLIIRSFVKPRENLTWTDYKPIFVTETRAKKGVEFWNAHQRTLNYAEKHYGVPASIIIAILGVETRYGSVKGHYRVIDSLSTLSFNHGRRAHFFQNELEQFLLLARENGAINAFTTKGSYAGAIGQVQFMPSSYRQFAVDATHKGYSNLISNSDDAILSIAHYLKHFGWIKNAPVAIPAQIKTSKHLHLPSQTKSFTIQTWKKYHIYPKKKTNLALKAYLIPLPIRHGSEYWLGFTNFQVIKRYNPSNLYAMAVYQLSELINHYHQSEQHLHDIKK